MLIYDSIDPGAIPTDVDAVAGYVDGLYGPAHATFRLPGWDAAGWARFPAAKQIGIAVSASTNAGLALDVEQGDAAPSEAPGWVRMRRAAGVAQPWLYCNRGNRTAVEAALQNAGIQPTECALWVATLDGTQSVPPRLYPVAAVQYANSTLAGGHYDISIVTTYGAASGALGVEDLTPDEHQWLFNAANEIRTVLTPALAQLAQEIAALKAEVDALKAGGGGAEPAEPKTMTFNLPAQQITGTLA